jgi:hypothetical protein
MFRARAADQAHAASAPGTAWPVHRVTARLIPGAGQGPPVSMPLDLTALQRRRSAEPLARPGASGASSWSPPDAIFRAFPLSLTTTVFSQRSTGWFDACPRRPTPEGQPSSISRTAPLQKDLLHGPPSTFMTHHPLTPWSSEVAPRSERRSRGGWRGPWRRFACHPGSTGWLRSQASAQAGLELATSTPGGRPRRSPQACVRRTGGPSRPSSGRRSRTAHRSTHPRSWLEPTSLEAPELAVAVPDRPTRLRERDATDRRPAAPEAASLQSTYMIRVRISHQGCH